MTNEDKKIVADYMKCIFSEYGGEYYYIPKNGKVIYFDLNDAGLVVQKMQKRGEWDEFYRYGMAKYSVIDGRSGIKQQDYVFWLFNAENFFSAFVEWRKRNEQS